MADMGTKEAAEKWGVSQVTVAKWCREGRIIPNPPKTSLVARGILKLMLFRPIKRLYK